MASVHLHSLILLLSSEEQVLFQRRCIQGHSIQKIAQETDRTCAATREACVQLRQRLYALLMQSGLSPGEARDWLYQELTHPL